MLPSPHQAFAVTGCCKARESYWKPWYEINITFKDCEDLNQEVEDGDNVFEESGQVWWDVVCESR